MTLLPSLTFWIANRWTSRSGTKGDLYDEPYRRMDGWMGGRTDVALGGARRTVGGGRSV
jgi:hypothetical protein